MIEPYAKAKRIVWCQEEPENMGAWAFLAPLLEDCFGRKTRVRRASSYRESRNRFSYLTQKGAGRDRLLGHAVGSDQEKVLTLTYHVNRSKDSRPRRVDQFRHSFQLESCEWIVCRD